jgi:hypothetical protein
VHRAFGYWIPLAAALAVACGHKSQSDPEDVSPLAGEVAVRIDSHYWSDVTISISRDGSWNRLGLAGSNKTTSFVVSMRLLGNSGTARLRADPIGNGDVTVSEGVPIHAGSLVVWSLESSLARSSIAVY